MAPENPTTGTADSEQSDAASDHLKNVPTPKRRKTAELPGDAPRYVEIGVNLIRALEEKRSLDEKRVFRAEERVAAAMAEKTTAQQESQATREEIKRLEEEIKSLIKQNRDLGRRLEVSPPSVTPYARTI